MMVGFITYFAGTGSMPISMKRDEPEGMKQGAQQDFSRGKGP